MTKRNNTLKIVGVIVLIMIAVGLVFYFSPKTPQTAISECNIINQGNTSSSFTCPSGTCYVKGYSDCSTITSEPRVKLRVQGNLVDGKSAGSWIAYDSNNDGSLDLYTLSTGELGVSIPSAFDNYCGPLTANPISGTPLYYYQNMVIGTLGYCSCDHSSSLTGCSHVILRGSTDKYKPGFFYINPTEGLPSQVSSNVLSTDRLGINIAMSGATTTGYYCEKTVTINGQATKISTSKQGPYTTSSYTLNAGDTILFDGTISYKITNPNLFCSISKCNSLKNGFFPCTTDNNGCSVQSLSLTSCGANQVCTDTSAGASCSCSAGTSCIKRCNEQDTGFFSCVTGSDGCLIQDTALTSCGPNQICTDSAAGAKCSCTGGACIKKCNSQKTGYYSCTTGSDGCALQGTSLTSCGANQVCADSSSGASCVCSGSTTCTSKCATDIAGFYPCSTDTCPILLTTLSRCTGNEICTQTGSGSSAICGCDQTKKCTVSTCNGQKTGYNECDTTLKCPQLSSTLVSCYAGTSCSQTGINGNAVCGLPTDITGQLITKDSYAIKEPIGIIKIKLASGTGSVANQQVTARLLKDTVEISGTRTVTLTNSAGEVEISFSYIPNSMDTITVDVIVGDPSKNPLNLRKNINILNKLEIKLTCPLTATMSRDTECSWKISDANTGTLLSVTPKITITQGSQILSYNPKGTSALTFKPITTGSVLITMEVAKENYLVGTDEVTIPVEGLTTGTTFNIDSKDFFSYSGTGIDTGTHTLVFIVEESGQKKEVQDITARIRTPSGQSVDIFFIKKSTGEFTASYNFVQAGQTYDLSGQIVPSDLSEEVIPFNYKITTLAAASTKDTTTNNTIIIGISIAAVILLIIIVVALTRRKKK